VFQQFGRLLVLLGVSIVVIGGLLWLGGRLGLGSLPGDIRFNNGRIGCLVPIASSIVISLVLTLLLNLLLRFFGK
jgi:hypothetical protein